MSGFDITGYLIFAFITAITPGPNNYLLFSYGKNYGFKDSLRFMSGIFSGFMVLLYVSGYGIGEIVSKNTTFGLILKIISSAWLFYLAILISRPDHDISADQNSKFGYYQGFFMQFINPKAWIMAITGASAFLPHLGNIHLNVFVFAFTFGLVGIPCMIAWISFGDLISGLLKSEKTNQRVGLVLFVLMIISIVMIWV